MPKHYDDCFPGSIRTDRNFSLYRKIIDGASKTPSKSFPEKHHIVPREWLTWKVDGFDFDSEDPENVVYLSVKGKILALQYLTLVFLDIGDSVTYRKMTETIARRYHLAWFQFWKNPYLDGNLVNFLTDKRKQELSKRKMKYSDEYLEKCRDILRSEPDEEAALEKMRSELGFRFSIRALREHIKKRFGDV